MARKFKLPGTLSLTQSARRCLGVFSGCPPPKGGPSHMGIEMAQCKIKVQMRPKINLSLQSTMSVESMLTKVMPSRSKNSRAMLTFSNFCDLKNFKNEFKPKYIKIENCSFEQNLKVWRENSKLMLLTGKILIMIHETVANFGISQKIIYLHRKLITHTTHTQKYRRRADIKILLNLNVLKNMNFHYP